MKKYIMIGLAATAMLAGCSRNEVIDINQENAISFDNAFVDNATRAEANTGNMKRFYVSAVMNDKALSEKKFAKVFDNQLVSNTASADAPAVWTYTPPQYWFANWDYDFIAFNLKDEAKAVAAMPGELQNFVSTYSIAYDNSKGTGYNAEEDLIYAIKNVNDVNENYTKKVDLTFAHALSRVKFGFTNKMGNPLITTQVKNIVITDATDKGTFTFSTKSWAVEDAKSAIDFSAIGSTANGVKGLSGEKYMIPNATVLNATFTIEIYNDGILVQSKNMSSAITFESPIAAGTSYVINAEITKEAMDLEAIEFGSITVDVWGTDTESSNIPIVPVI